MEFKFKQFVESMSNPVVYHVTYYKNLDLISDEGLDFTEYGGANFLKPFLQRNSQLGNFFTTNINQIGNWVETLEYQANDISDNIYEDGLIPIVLKFKINRNTHQPDQHSEYPDSYYTQTIIQPQGIQCWTGVNWIPISSWIRINTGNFIDYVDGYPGEEYYQLRADYPLPK